MASESSAREQCARWVCFLVKVRLLWHSCDEQGRDKEKVELFAYEIGGILGIEISQRRWGREGNGTRLQYSCLENSMDGGAWKAAVRGVTKSRIRLSNFTFPFHFHALEKEMPTHSGVLAWRIPGMGEPGGLSSMGSHRIGHN